MLAQGSLLNLAAGTASVGLDLFDLYTAVMLRGISWPTEENMPFAAKFRAMMDLPFAGEALDGFDVESIDVSHRSDERGYAYSIRIVLRGHGGQQGVRRALKPLLSAHPTTFSGYGNPYQLWFGKPEIQSLGERRYIVSVEGAGARVVLGEELDRFLQHLDEQGQLADRLNGTDREALVKQYLESYRADIRRRVDRYRRRLRKTRDAGP